uniref:non-specific serine/threonine protein kinase n=1 Tax=Onchocerca volvulus TaxID=6282 RepID=A0A2K6VEI4_ONCVO
MVRRRFVSKGNATFVDGLDKTVLKEFAGQDSLFRRTAMFANILNDVLSQKRDSLQSDLCKMKKKEGRRRAKPIDRTNITTEELEYQRLLTEIKEAEEYELVVERDSNSNLCRDGLSKMTISQVQSETSKFFSSFLQASSKIAGCEKAHSKEEQENEVAKANFDKSRHSTDLSLEKSRNVNQLDIAGSPLIFIVHPSEPTTSTPLQASRSTCTSRLHQDMFKFDDDAQLSPIILNKKDVVCDINEKAASTICSRSDGNEEVKRKSSIETIDCKRSASEAMILTTLQKSSPQLTILNSPGHWGFQNEEYKYENVTTSEYGDRSLSLYDGTGENKPFYLNGFPWTARYAKNRDYKQELFHLCTQKSIQPWRLRKTILDLSNPIKLGEGTFGEVFRVNYKGEIVALKVIPIGGTKMVNGDKQKSFRDIAAELIVSKELSDLKQTEDGYSTQGFIHLRGAVVVKGSYPKSLIIAWEQYDKRMKSENDHPCIFNSSQHFLLLAFEDGGTDLEKYVIANVLQAYSIIYQVLLAISVAEYRLSFEHRDLHCGNILIRNVQSDAVVKTDYNGTEISICTYGVEVKIIDFTLSRMSKGTSTIFFDLAKDDELFAGEDCLQYEIYRAMRMVNKNNWFPFCSMTNVLWLIYLVRYLYDSMDEKNTGNPSERKDFIYHFKDLHRYASLSEWLAEKASKRNDFIVVVKENH